MKKIALLLLMTIWCCFALAQSGLASLENELSRLRQELRILNVLNSQNQDVMTLGRNSGVSEQVDAAYKAAWEKANPFTLSSAMPRTPQSWYDAAYRQAGERKIRESRMRAQYLQQKIASIERKLAEEENSKSAAQ